MDTSNHLLKWPRAAFLQVSSSTPLTLRHHLRTTAKHRIPFDKARLRLSLTLRNLLRRSSTLTNNLNQARLSVHRLCSISGPLVTAVTLSSSVQAITATFQALPTALQQGLRLSIIQALAI